MKTSSLLIRTPEGIIFSQLLAGPVTRFLAWLIDILCIGVLLNVLGTLLRVLDLLSLNISLAAITVGYFVINTGYGIFCEWAWRGQTIGKRLLGLRVVDAEGMRMQFNQIVTRNLLRFVDMLPAFYLVGGAACWFSRRCQRLGDVAANTIVIRTAAVTEPNLDQLAPGKFNSLRHYPHLAARLSDLLSKWTGRRWIASVSSDIGKPTLSEQKAAKGDELRSRAENDPMVQAILRTFPGAKLETVRRKGDQASLVADLVGPRDEPVVEDYPADDDIPESEF